MSPSDFRRDAIEAVGKEIGVQLALDPLAQTRGLTADAVATIIDAYDDVIRRYCGAAAFDSLAGVSYPGFRADLGKLQGRG